MKKKTTHYVVMLLLSAVSILATSCKGTVDEPVKSSETTMRNFIISVSSKDYPIVFEGIATKDTIYLPTGSNVPSSVIVKTIELAYGATGVKENDIVSITNGIATFNVTAEDGTKKEYQVIVLIAPAIPIDGDGNIYSTVQIGDQVWLKENLRTTKLNDGTPIPNSGASQGFYTDAEWKSLTTAAYCAYGYNSAATAETGAANKTKYGLIYNWYVVKTGKLAPAGWHVATIEDWYKLETFVGKKGGGIKLKTTTGWPTVQGSDTYGFNGLPGGVRWGNATGNPGSFGFVGQAVVWWSSTERGNDRAWDVCLWEGVDDFNAHDGNDLQEQGQYIRCVKD
jgi:uncharacterized protein (TIGR02145 family)